MNVMKLDIAQSETVPIGDVEVRFTAMPDHVLQVELGKLVRQLKYVTNERCTADFLELYLITSEFTDRFLLCGGNKAYLLTPELEVIEETPTGEQIPDSVAFLPVAVAQNDKYFVFCWDDGFVVFGARLNFIASSAKYADDLLVQLLDDSLVFHSQSDDQLRLFYPESPQKSYIR